MKIQIYDLPKINDTDEFELKDRESGKRALATVTGQRKEVDGRTDLDSYKTKATEQFTNDIKNNKLNNDEVVRYCFFSTGDFTCDETGARDVEVKLRVAQYGKDRFHIEIPSELKEIFSPGESVIVKK